MSGRAKYPVTPRQAMGVRVANLSLAMLSPRDTVDIFTLNMSNKDDLLPFPSY